MLAVSPPRGAPSTVLDAWRAEVKQNQRRFKMWIRDHKSDADRARGVWVVFQGDKPEPARQGSTVIDAVRGLSGPVFIGHMIMDAYQDGAPMMAIDARPCARADVSRGLMDTSVYAATSAVQLASELNKVCDSISATTNRAALLVQYVNDTTLGELLGKLSTLLLSDPKAAALLHDEYVRRHINTSAELGSVIQLMIKLQNRKAELIQKLSC